MIIEALCMLIFGLVTLLLNMIPSISLPDGFALIFDDIAYLISGANFFLPIPTILLCFTTIFLVDNAKFLMSIFNWIISKIPGIN